MYTTLIISLPLCKQDVFPVAAASVLAVGDENTLIRGGVLHVAGSALAAAARREKEANLTKLLDEFGIQHEDACNLAAAGVRTVEDLIMIDEEDFEALSLSLSLSLMNKKKLLKLLVHVGSPAFLAAAAKKKQEEEAQAAAAAAEAGLKRAQEEEQRLMEAEEWSKRQEQERLKAEAKRQLEEEKERSLLNPSR